MSQEAPAPPNPRRTGPEIGTGGKIFILAGFLIVPTIVVNLMGRPGFDPTEFAIDEGDVIEHVDPRVPPVCFVQGEGIQDTCWTCHDSSLATETLAQKFSTMPWPALQDDHSATYRQISEGEIDVWIQSDNLSLLWEGLEDLPDWNAPIPRIDPGRGVDQDGFLKDSSGWRAVRQVPFPAISWPTHGRHGDVWMRMARPFHRDASGQPSRSIAVLNHALIRAAVRWSDAQAVVVAAVDERLIDFDLNQDGEIGTGVTTIKQLPQHYAGAAHEQGIVKGQHPVGTEFVQFLRYLDPDRDDRLSVRVRELRYAIREGGSDADQRAERLAARKSPRRAAGDVLSGHLSLEGWRMVGFLENARGQLRVQSEAEAQSCFGCHEALSTTRDGTFTTLRQLPGSAGWARQDLNGMSDLPLQGATQGELLTYFLRAGTADHFGENTQLRDRVHPGASWDRAALEALAVGGTSDLASLLYPSRARAYDLNRMLRHGAALRNAATGGRWTRPRALSLAPPSQRTADAPRPRHDDFQLPLADR